MGLARKLSIAVAIAATASGGVARAQAVEAAPAIPVEIGAGEGARDIQLHGTGGAIACGTHCSLALPQGRYRLLVTDTGGHLSNQWLPVQQSSRLIVTPANRGARIAGIVTMGAGLGAAAVGGFLLWATLIGRTGDCFEACNDDWPRGQLYGGAITLAAGAAVAVTGLLIWRRNVHAVVREEAPPGAGLGLRFAPIAGLHLAGLGLTGRF
jgi:hypothetical protein